ncbi:DUF1697 domain-containing protein [Arthrobacter sp. 7Tela_A1]|uniref:DUF1697 domain-containing protein n=1 Tax=Arthrobacter sp. 7Tela_A1 TaxID=3093745 RepID=UPI003BB513E7
MNGSATRFAILLRGVNVGGVTVKMADLRAVLQSLGLLEVQTLLASGNAVVTSVLEPAVLKDTVEHALRTEFGYEAWVIVLPMARVAELAETVPYAADDPAVHAYVTFSSDPAILDELLDVGAAGGQEQVRLGPEAMAWTARKGLTLDSALSKATGKLRYKSATTTRNLRTLRKIAGAG